MNYQKTRLQHGLRATLLLFLTMLINYTGSAQALKSYLFTTGAPGFYVHDVHGYSTEAIPGTTLAVMAGTLGMTDGVGSSNYGGGVPHIMIVDQNADVDTGGAFVASATIRHQDYEAVRVIDVALDNNNDILLTCWVRRGSLALVRGDGTPEPAAPLSSTIAPTDRDFIKIFKINYDDAEPEKTFTNAGAIMFEKIIWDNGAIGDLDIYGRSWYPTHTAYKEYSDGNGPQERLYICGYHTFYDSRYGNESRYQQPTYADDKDAFVIAFDVVDEVIKHAKYFNSLSVSAISAPNPVVDYDMAMRIRPITNNGTDYLYVTGSVNAQTGILNTGFVRSAVMNLVLDTNMSIVADNPFIISGNMDGYGENEYGVDIVFNTEQNTNDFHIVSNTFESSIGVSADPELNAINPYSINVTYIENNYIPFAGTRVFSNSTSSQREWAIHVLPTDVTTVNGGDNRFMIVGMMANNRCVLAGGGVSSMNNMNPFFADVQFYDPYGGSNFDAATHSGNFGYVYKNRSSTNTYNTIVGNIGNIFSNPTFAAKPSATSNFVYFNTPKYELGFNTLGLKIGFDDISNPNGSGTGGTTNNSTCGFVTCTPAFNDENIETGLTVSVATPTTAIDAEESYLVDEYPAWYGDCHFEDMSHPSYPTWQGYKPGKPTAINSITNNKLTTVYPNPANTVVHVQPADDVTGDIKVVLVNMFGQHISTMYDGKAEKINANVSLQLPQVATGLYMVQIYNNGQRIHNEKLSIQQ